MHSHLNRLAGRPPPLAKPTDSQATSHLQRWEGMLHRAACLQFNQCAFLVFVDGLSHHVCQPLLAEKHSRRLLFPE